MDLKNFYNKYGKESRGQETHGKLPSSFDKGKRIKKRIRKSQKLPQLSWLPNSCSVYKFPSEKESTLKRMICSERNNSFHTIEWPLLRREQEQFWRSFLPWKCISYQYLEYKLYARRHLFDWRDSFFCYQWGNTLRRDNSVKIVLPWTSTSEAVSTLKKCFIPSLQL